MYVLYCVLEAVSNLYLYFVQEAASLPIFCSGGSIYTYILFRMQHLYLYFVQEAASLPIHWGEPYYGGKVNTGIKGRFIYSCTREGV